MFAEADLSRYFRYAVSLTENEDDAFDLLQQSVMFGEADLKKLESISIEWKDGFRQPKILLTVKE